MNELTPEEREEYEQWLNWLLYSQDEGDQNFSSAAGKD